MFNWWNELISARSFARREQMRESENRVPSNPFLGHAIARGRVPWLAMVLQVESHGGDGSPACTAAVVSCLMQARSDFFFLRSAHSRSLATRTRPPGSGGSDLSSVRRLPVSPVSAAFRVCVLRRGAEPSGRLDPPL